MGEFLTPEEIRPLYPVIIPVYQRAFEGPPWNEVSKCADARQRCIGGLSALAVGELCQTCNCVPTEQAYTYDELVVTFDAIAERGNAAWYIEKVPAGTALVALAWKATVDEVWQAKYADAPAMRQWLTNEFGTEPLVWLDEVFADKEVRPNKNLASFEAMNQGFASRLGAELIAYRTKTPQMIAAAKKISGIRVYNVESYDSMKDRKVVMIPTGGRS